MEGARAWSVEEKSKLTKHPHGVFEPSPLSTNLNHATFNCCCICNHGWQLRDKGTNGRAPLRELDQATRTTSKTLFASTHSQQPSTECFPPPPLGPGRDHMQGFGRWIHLTPCRRENSSLKPTLKIGHIEFPSFQWPMTYFITAPAIGAGGRMSESTCTFEKFLCAQTFPGQLLRVTNTTAPHFRGAAHQMAPVSRFGAETRALAWRQAWGSWHAHQSLHQTTWCPSDSTATKGLIFVHFAFPGLKSVFAISAIIFCNFLFKHLSSNQQGYISKVRSATPHFLQRQQQQQQQQSLAGTRTA